MFAALLLVAQLAGAAPPPPPHPSTLPPGARISIITMPTIVQTPSAQDMAGVYPQRAGAERVSGKVILQCRVRATGLLSDCVVADETPPDYGFGEAALQLVPAFLMKPQAKDGKPVDGALIRIPLVFIAQ